MRCPDDHLRAARLCIWSFLWASPVAHIWFSLLDKLILPRSPTSLLAAIMKMAIDQTVMAPLGLAVFFMSIKVSRKWRAARGQVIRFIGLWRKILLLQATSFCKPYLICPHMPHMIGYGGRAE